MPTHEIRTGRTDTASACRTIPVEADGGEIGLCAI
jgi:hypothetical protein